MLGLSRWISLPWTGILVIALAILGGLRPVGAWSLPPWMTSFWNGFGPIAPVPSVPAVPVHRLYNETTCMQVFHSFTTTASSSLVELNLVEPQRLCAALVAAQRAAPAPADRSEETACARLAHEIRSGFERQEGHWIAQKISQRALLDAADRQGGQMHDLRREFNATTEALRVSQSAASLLDFGIASCFLWTVAIGFVVSMIHRNMLQVTPERTFGLFLVWSLAAFVELVVFQAICSGLETLFGAFELWKHTAEPFVSHGLWICAPLMIDLVAVSGAVGVGAVVRLGIWASQTTGTFASSTGVDNAHAGNNNNNAANKPVLPSPEFSLGPLGQAIRGQWPGMGFLRPITMPTTPVNSTLPMAAVVGPVEGAASLPEPGNEGYPDKVLTPEERNMLKRAFRLRA